MMTDDLQAKTMGGTTVSGRERETDTEGDEPMDGKGTIISIFIVNFHTKV